MPLHWYLAPGVIEFLPSKPSGRQVLGNEITLLCTYFGNEYVLTQLL
jgi:hypothetical protein